MLQLALGTFPSLHLIKRFPKLGRCQFNADDSYTGGRHGSPGTFQLSKAVVLHGLAAHSFRKPQTPTKLSHLFSHFFFFFCNFVLYSAHLPTWSLAIWLPKEVRRERGEKGTSMRLNWRGRSPRRSPELSQRRMQRKG